jgi:hypothetical protein
MPSVDAMVSADSALACIRRASAAFESSKAFARPMDWPRVADRPALRYGAHIEKSFRMSKHDLQARPIYHHIRESIEAHLSIVVAALATSHCVEHQPAAASRNSCELPAATAPSRSKLAPSINRL